jgi:DNA invertase Pin-like site-specific DNA recombinase
MQRAGLKKRGYHKTLTDDLQSGATTNRPEFQKCLKKLAKADSLIVWKLVIRNW